MLTCSCNLGVPAIAEIAPTWNAFFLARHCCTHCGKFFFDVELAPGMQLIATRELSNLDGSWAVPAGRMLRITAFSELAPAGTGLLFSGLLGAGIFRPEGFAARWNIEAITALA